VSLWSQIWRPILFAALIASLVGVYTVVAGPAIPKFPLVSTKYLLIPMMVISGVLAFPAYAILSRHQSRSRQILTLYQGLVLTSMIYGAFGWMIFPDGHPMHIIVALLAGHFWGLPLLVALIPVHVVLARLHFYGAPDHPRREN